MPSDAGVDLRRKATRAVVEMSLALAQTRMEVMPRQRGGRAARLERLLEDLDRAVTLAEFESIEWEALRALRAASEREPQPLPGVV